MPNVPSDLRQTESVHSYVQQEEGAPSEKRVHTRTFLFLIGTIGFIGLIASFLTLHYLGVIKLSNLLPFLTFLPTRNIVETKPLFALSINGQTVSWEEFDGLTQFVMHVQNIADEQQAQHIATNTLVERSLLRKEAEKNNIAISDVDIRKAVFASTTSAALAEAFPGYDESLKDRMLKEKVEPIVIAKRTGRYIFVAFGFTRPELQTIDQKTLALEKISTARNRILTGEDFSTVGKELDQDPQVQLLNKGIAFLEFTNMQKDKALFSDEFTNVIFSLQKGHASDIVTIDNDPGKWGREPGHTEFGFAVAMVDDISQGGYASYAEWVNAEKGMLEIISNVD